MPGASLALFADLGACHVQKSSVTICVLPALPVKRYRRSISIHALRVEGDRRRVNTVGAPGISIHALRVEGDAACGTAWRCTVRFLSTPSGWRATRNNSVSFTDLTISIHALRVEGDDPEKTVEVTGGGISIHALRVEGDLGDIPPKLRVLISIHALRVEGDDWMRVNARALCMISIHALRVEGDISKRVQHRYGFVYFYPRPPGGGRPKNGTLFYLHSISIHALRVEGDTTISSACVRRATIFLSTPSGWRATGHHYGRNAKRNNFYPRPPGGGRRAKVSAPVPKTDFYPRPPGGGRLLRLKFTMAGGNFYPRPPGGGRRIRQRRRDQLR